MFKIGGKLVRLTMILMVISLLSTLALSVVAAPITGSITVPAGQTAFSIDIYVNEPTACAGISFAMTISNESALTFESFTPKISGVVPLPFVKNGGLHSFGVMSGSNNCPAGSTLVGTMEFTGYTGDQALTIAIVEMKVSRIVHDEQTGWSETVTIEKESPAYVFTIQRAGQETPVPASVTVTANLSSIAIPGTATASAVVRDADGNILTGQTVVWSLVTSYAGVSIDSSTGVITVASNAAPGTVTVRGTCGAVSGTFVLTLTGGGGSGNGDSGNNTGGNAGGNTGTITDPETPLAFRYTDVTDPEQWYFEAVYYLRDYGLMYGTSEDRFSTDTPVTRAMFVTILGRLAGKMGETTTGYTNPFNDVAAGQWYTEYVAWGAAKGIVKGFSATRFAPNVSVTREQMAALLVRFADYMEIELKDDVEITFTDAGSISDWAREDVERVTAAGLMQGNQGRFRPLSTATRAEVAQLFMNFVKAYLI